MPDHDVVLSKELSFHRRFARSGVIVDVGAHTGDFAFGMIDIPGLSVVAIEPLAWASKVLQRRISESNAPIKLIETAVSDFKGKTNLHVPVLADGGPVRPWASVVKDFRVLSVHHPEIVDVISSRVTVTTLDTLSLSNVTAIKIDAEGNELEVLRGARRLLSKMRPIISVELEERHRLGCTYAVPAYMDAFEYQCFFEIGDTFYPFSKFNRQTMQRGSPSPASHEYSLPYVGGFYFIPKERKKILKIVSNHDQARIF